MEEICLCHGEIWTDRIDLFKHQIKFYMRKSEKNRNEAEISRAALARAGGKPEELIKEQEILAKEERRLKTYCKDWTRKRRI